MTFFYTILAILGILFIIYRFYIDYFYLTSKKRKYNKSADAVNWYRKTRVFDRFLYGKAADYPYKILKEPKNKDCDDKETQN